MFFAVLNDAKWPSQGIQRLVLLAITMVFYSEAIAKKKLRQLAA